MRSEWAIRTILAPVITRLQIGGINSLDLEQIVATLDNEVMLNASFLSRRWYQLWGEKGRFYSDMARKAAEENNILTARALLMEAARSYFAAYLIHSQDIKINRKHYSQLKDCFAGMFRQGNDRVEKTSVQLSGDKKLAAYLFAPQREALVGSIVLYAGLGSCKEEMYFLVDCMVDRGIAVLIPDMPGCGKSLFENEMKCVPETVEAAYSACLHFLQHHPFTLNKPVGSSGLCMGGGFAFRAAALNNDYALCATLFPLFISEVAEGKTPQWMKSGNWFDFQTGKVDAGRFQKQMGFRKDERLNCPFYIAHGRTDNWMTIDSALRLLDYVDHPVKEKLVVEEGASIGDEPDVLHALPVGEQIHWVKHLFADWIWKQFTGGHPSR